MDIPVEIINLIEMFKTDHMFFKNGCLAGGAPRDLLNDKPVKDWDFFFDINYKPLSVEGKNFVKSKMAEVGFFPNREIINPLYDTKEWEVATYLEPKSKTEVQLIWSRDDIDQFDHSCCMIKYDYNKDLLVTNEFYNWTMWNRIHLLLINNFMTNYQIEKAVKSHTPRITKKYPWPVIMKNISSVYLRTSAGRNKVIEEIEKELEHVKY